MVLDSLLYIKEHIDPTLTFRRLDIYDQYIVDPAEREFVDRAQ